MADPGFSSLTSFKLSSHSNLAKLTPTKGQLVKPLVKLQSTWTTRTTDLMAHGYDFRKHIMPVIQYDTARVKSGSKGYSNLEAQALIDSLKSGKNPFQPKHTGGGLLGVPSHILGDAAAIGTGLLHLPEMLIHDVPQFAKDFSHGMPEWKGGNITQIFDNLSRTPLIRLLPGIYTGQTIAHGNWKDFEEHPLMHTLDVLPYASSASKLLTAGAKAGAEGSVMAALQAGEPLRAVSRVPMLPSKVGLRSPADLATVVGRKLGTAKELRAGERVGNQALHQAPRTGLESHLAAWDGLLEQRKASVDLLAKAEQKLTEGDIAAAKVLSKQAEKATIVARNSAGTLRKAADSIKAQYFANKVGLTRDEAMAQSARDAERGLYKRELAGKIHRDPAKVILKRKFVTLPQFATRLGLGAEEKAWLDAVIRQDKGVGAEDIFIPNWVNSAYRTLELERRIRGSHVGNILDSGTDIFRYAVLTGPRHFVHILASNMMFSMLREGPHIFTHWGQSWDMVRNTKPWMEDVARGLGTFNDELNGVKTEHLVQLKFGETLARIWYEAGQTKLGKKPIVGIVARGVETYAQSMRLFESLASDMFRAMSYLEETSKGKALGLDELGAHAHAVDALTKVYMDIDGLTPIEKTIFRRVVPFYSFERQLISYALRFPADYPWRAAILSNVGRSEMEQLGSQLPMTADSLFFLNAPDKQGNNQVIDLRNWDPFRTFASNDPLTLVGFLSTLNPVLRTPFIMQSGPQSIWGSPDFYQQLTVDPYSGAFKVKQNPLQSILYGAEQVVPEINTLDAVLKLSDQARGLAQSADKSAFRRFVFTNLGIPFVPYNYNEGQQRAKYLSHWYTVSKQDAARYMKNGQYADISQYQKVPFGANLFTPSQLEQLKAQILKMQQKAG